ncbi:hypothetical protein EDD18DRAFT_1107897 [Armillaria luteobubalina]|uniref:Ribonuclease H1 N-terminal domain-containing protein n=1 Tax=Armillaria luteobubalina TaxID=153913 RepID=A0AA39PZS0_9AGAR|nr:hypothetical protein EDD18DRAFT_1107897 [Armillaria luteobubalina]
MTQINIDQVSTLLAGLGLLPSTNSGTIQRDGRNNSLIESSERSSSSGAATATQNDGVPPALASTPDSAVPTAVPQDAPSVPAAGSSVDAAATATTGPDGPWYSIIKGRAVGVFRGWQNVTPLVTGVSRSCYLRHPTQAAAQAAFKEAIMSGSTEVLQCLQLIIVVTLWTTWSNCSSIPAATAVISRFSEIPWEF